MIKKITIAAFFLFAAFGSVLAQQRNCASMESLEKRMKKNPALKQRMAEIENFTQKAIKNRELSRIDGSIITIPVVVHVIYSNSQENISTAQIQSQIDVLNEDFRRLNSDADNTWSQAADTEIEFCLATVDPNGNSTTGITRKSSTTTSWGTNDAMKSSAQGGVDPWDTSQYLNMWVCNIGGGILGYAQFPGGSAATDGVVMGPQYFGSSAKGSGFYLSSPFDLGRTTTHEVGHYFNLRHIWGDGGCSVDDFVSDTPTSDAANYGCSTGHSSCGSVDMVQNYMDYSDDSCMNLYTQGQKDRMRAVLAEGGVRRSLALSDKCDGGGSTPTCSDGIQNGDETGVDCGGSCEPCQTSSNCTGEISTFPYSETFESGIGAWTQDSNDNLDWTRDSGGTPSSSTGPSSGADGSFYMFIESSTSGTGYPNKTAFLNSPCFDLTSAAQATFEFSYHMYGSSMGTLTLEASIDNGSTWASLWSTTGNQGDSWFTASVNLSAYLGDTVKLRFNGVTGSSYTSDMAIDAITLTTDSSGGGGTECTNISLSITFDNYPEETSWEILDSNGAVAYSGGTYGDQADGSTLNLTGCIDDGCYTLVFYDSYGDGMCCSYGNGSYTLTNTDTGTVLVTGGSFSSSQSDNFCLGNANRQDTIDVIAKTDNSSVFIMYPNPVFGNFINVKTTASKITYSIINMLGQEVSKGETSTKAIDVSQLSRGTYMINLQADGKKATKRFIKE
ncbi:M43 family zinc metalloprotease [Abyssalbus ytuae]|uniref:M43 family zinc metalloprotease n=1 Tax=Abyssalbus ytuae TaxID=2926907 RepID=A0A9E6ZQA6_9FLAO|nr:M43 family zinc metalloprotease [Abyssalbus ytuae]UOB15943.1 M43 family zinc metalloprotease [Abyssalbus ytuae]